MKRSVAITWDQVKVSAVVLLGIAVLGFGLYYLGRAANLFGSRYRLVAYLPSANGLLVGGSVMVAGQLAGTVKSIDFLPVDVDTLRNLRVTIEVNEDVREQIRMDSRGRLRTLGLLGDKVFDIAPGTPRARPLREGETVPVEAVLDYEQVLAQASGAVGDVVGLTHDFRTLTSGIVRGEGTVGQLVTNRAMYDELTGTLSRANAMFARVQNSRGTVGRLLDDPALYVQMTTMLRSADSLVLALNRSEGTLGRLLRDDSLYVQLVGMAGGANALLTQISTGNGLAGKLLTDQALYDQLVKLVADLSAVMADVRRDPRRYFKGAVKVF